MDDKEIKKTRKRKTTKFDEKPEEKGLTKKVVAKKKKEVEVEDVKKSLEFSLVEVIIFIFVTAIAVSIVSGVIVYRNYSNISNKVNPSNKNEIIDNYNYIIENYVNEVDKDGLTDAAIRGMYDYLEDEYSVYMSKETTNTLQEQLGGKYSGIGIEITMNENSQVVINRVFSNSPALKAGLKKGDILIKINDVSLEGKDSSFVANSIKNSDEKSFNITYLRDGKEYTSIIEKDIISIDTVETTEYDNVGYLKIDTFSSVTASQVKNKISEFSNNIKSIVIDLRDNTGGYLDSAFDVSELFVDKGKNIYGLKNKNGDISFYKAKDGVFKSFDKIVILINHNSASASEIVTLALKENLNAKVIGVTSFGKGTVQETKMLNSGAMVKYTSSYWLSPNGNTINKIGIKPDIEIEKEEEQLQRAIEEAK